MKVLIHYEDNENSELHKSLKITLPKKWKTGPTHKLLDQFIETYNSAEAFASNPLTASDMHLSVRQVADGKSQLIDLPSDAIVVDVIADYADVYVNHGPSTSLAEQKAKEAEAQRAKEELMANTVACTHFGCKNRFPKGGPYPQCTYHQAPPVFHETAKFWSCCPHKKAYDWETFQEIPGCQTGTCTDVKEPEQKQFLGGTDLREQLHGSAAPLKSIDDFNKAQAAGGADAAPVLERLQAVCIELGIETELYEQVIQGIQTDLEKDAPSMSSAELLEATKAEMGLKLKNALKAIAAEQLRIK